MNDRETERKRRRDMKRVRVDAARDMRDVQRLDSAFIVPDSENFWWMFHRIAEGDKSLFEFFGFGD